MKSKDVDALEDLVVRPVVRDRAQEEDICVGDRPDARYLQRTLRLEEVLRLVRYAACVEDVRILTSPRLHDQ